MKQFDVLKNLPFEVSSMVERGTYVNFPKSNRAKGKLFMVGYEECAPDYLIEREGFPSWTLECVIGGHGFYQEGKKTRCLRHGSVFTFGPNVPVRFGNERERPFRKYFMVSDGDGFPASWQQAGLGPGRMIQLGSAASIVSIFDQLLAEGQRSDGQTVQVVSGLEGVLLALMARHQGTASGDKSGSRKVYDLAMDILQREYRVLHGLSDLADRAGYSGEYLCRVFRKYHGESPYQVLVQRKMSAAWLLLRDGQLQVGAIGRELGYEDQMHFSRVFRKVMGCAPSSVRTFA